MDEKGFKSHRMLNINMPDYSATLKRGFSYGLGGKEVKQQD
jgi:hypothetical protein